MAETFRRREQTVQAVRYMADTYPEVCAFLGYTTPPPYRPEAPVYVACDDYAEPGDWVVKVDDRYRVMTDWDFREQYERAPVEASRG